MESLYVIETGAYIRREGKTLNVVKDRRVIEHIPGDGLKRLVLVGFVSLSGGVLDFLIQNRVETVFITPTGRFRARLIIDEHRHVQIRKAQYLRLSDDSFAFRTALILVKGKMKNMYSMLRKKTVSQKEKDLKKNVVKLKGMISNLDNMKTDIQVLRGMEGASTRIFYSVFSYLIKNDEFPFTGRNRRPPLDPVNALLSFVYTLLTNEVLSAIKACGLDPYMGALHEIRYGRPSLACDLVEEFRFIGERLTLGLINRKMIKTGDFVYREIKNLQFADEQELKSKRPVEMKPGVCKSFIASYEKIMNNSVICPITSQTTTYRWIIHRQVRSFSEYLENPDIGYVPFRMES